MHQFFKSFINIGFMKSIKGSKELELKVSLKLFIESEISYLNQLIFQSPTIRDFETLRFETF